MRINRFPLRRHRSYIIVLYNTVPSSLCEHIRAESWIHISTTTKTESKSSLKLCGLVLASDTWNTVPYVMLYIKNHGKDKKKTLHEYTFIYFSLLVAQCSNSK